jgi:hypothetical protein
MQLSHPPQSYPCWWLSRLVATDFKRGSLNRWIRSSEFSGYHADFQGHGMAGAQHSICELARHGHGIVCIYIGKVYWKHVLQATELKANKSFTRGE